MEGSLTRRRFLRLTGGAVALTAVDALAPMGVLDRATAAAAPVADSHFGNAPSGHTSRGLVVVDVLYTPAEAGYWVLVSDGTVINIDAPWFGDRPGLAAGEHVAAMASTPTGNGYWLFTSTGRVFAYGAAVHHGDLSALTLDGPIVDASALADGSGYYMLGSDGGIFTLGGARFHGSVPQVLPGVTLDQPLNGLVPNGVGGYWLVAGDGGLFTFGDAVYGGSVPQVLPGVQLAAPVVGALRSGTAYLMVASDGGIFNFGTSVFHGSRPEIAEGDDELRSPVTCVDVLDDRSGYLMIDEVGTPWGFGASAPPNFGPTTGTQARHTHDYLAKWDLDTMPFRWASSEPIHYVLNNDLGPPQAPDIVFAAIADLEAATGLAFVFDGFTTEYVGHQLVGGTEVPDPRSSYQPSRYGERWAPVWIGARPDFTFTSTVGQAGPVPHMSLRATQTVVIDGVTYTTGEPTWVSGTVAYHWKNGGVITVENLEAIIRHELGHLVGLNHATDHDQLMFPSITGVDSYQPGDKLGLHLVGSATGHPVAPPPSQGTVIGNVGLSSLTSPARRRAVASAPCHLAELGPCTR